MNIYADNSALDERENEIKYRANTKMWHTAIFWRLTTDQVNTIRGAKNITQYAPYNINMTTASRQEVIDHAMSTAYSYLMQHNR